MLHLGESVYKIRIDSRSASIADTTVTKNNRKRALETMNDIITQAI
jgi:hypothetical protein